MGDGVGVGEVTGRKAAWARARVSGEGMGRKAYRRLSLLLVGSFFTLYRYTRNLSHSQS